jgi:hypothetical protein
MSTRAEIIYVDDDNRAHMVHCHYDGYPSYVGKMLKTFYTDERLLKQLTSHGHMSSLGETIEQCEFYRRDLHEPYRATRQKIFEFNSDNISKYVGDDIDYTYVWKNHCWNLYHFGRKNLKKLTNKMCETMTH